MPLKKKKAPKKTLKKKVIKKLLKKKVVRKNLKKKPALKKKTVKKTAKIIKSKAIGNAIGKITHYFPHVNAGVVKLKAPLAVGDTIKIKGHTTDITQIVNSMQIDRVPVNQAKKGDEVGLEVNSRVRRHDVVYKI